MSIFLNEHGGAHNKWAEIQQQNSKKYSAKSDKFLKASDNLAGKAKEAAISKANAYDAKATDSHIDANKYNTKHLYYNGHTSNPEQEKQDAIKFNKMKKDLFKKNYSGKEGSKFNKDLNEKIQRNNESTNLFDECADYVIGCINEEYDIDEDLLKESAEYILNAINEME